MHEVWGFTCVPQGQTIIVEQLERRRCQLGILRGTIWCSHTKLGLFLRQDLP